MIVMELFRILDKTQPVEIIQDADKDNNSYISIQCMPDAIPVHILDCSIDKVSHGKDVLVIELCR